MHRKDDDTRLSAEELELAKRGEELIAAAVADTRAPHSLRERIERDRERAQATAGAPFWRRRARPLAALATALAAVAAVVVALQPAAETAAPSLASIEAAARLEATQPAPRVEGGEPPVLAARVGAIPFPDWRKSFGWRAVGSREDEIAGRTVKTVIYRDPEGVRLGYSIVGGEPIPEHPPGRRVIRQGNAYHVARRGRHTLVTWVQQGHTCAIVASAAVPESRLVELAASRNV
jgi:hypothetical protein